MAGATGGIVLSVLVTGKGREEAEEQTQGGIITKMFKAPGFFALITLSAAEQGCGGGKSKGKS